LVHDLVTEAKVTHMEKSTLVPRRRGHEPTANLHAATLRHQERQLCDCGEEVRDGHGHDAEVHQVGEDVRPELVE